MYNVSGDLFMDNIEIINLIENCDLKEYKKDFKKILKQVKKTLNINHNLSLSLTICSNEYIAELNSQYRGIDRETDVLSFALEDEMEQSELEQMVELTGVRELGDIIINIERVYSQAKEYGHSEKREFCFLFTHGLLHLLGYDHMEKEDEIVMFGLQDEVLSSLKINR